MFPSLKAPAHLRSRDEYGSWGRNELMDLARQYQADIREAAQRGVDFRTGQEFTDKLLEAYQAGDWDLLEAQTQADFRSFLWEPIAASFYQGYDSAAGQFSRYTGKKNLSSFDVHRIKGTNGLQRISYVGESGGYVEMTRSFRPETGIAVDTYGGMLEYTRKLARTNGAQRILAEIPREMGEAMADFVTAMVISFIVANPAAPDGTSMYHASRGNLVTTALTEDALIDMAVWLGTRKNPDGRPIRAKVKYAVCQNARQQARLLQILKSMTLELTGVSSTALATTAMGRGTANTIPDLGVLSADGIVVDPYVPDAEDVYFFDDPDHLEAFTVGYLDGQEQPHLLEDAETAMHLARSSASGADPYSFDGDAIRYKVRHDLGVQAVEPIATYKQSPA